MDLSTVHSSDVNGLQIEMDLTTLYGCDVSILEQNTVHSSEFSELHVLMELTKVHSSDVSSCQQYWYS
jgi:hypothetical protein